MSHWHLCPLNESRHTQDMRLPRRIFPSLVSRIVSIVLFATSVTFMSLSAWASTPTLAVYPSALRFGNLPVGQSETQITVLTNTGQTSATISAIDMGDPSFSVSGLSLPT